MRKQDIAKALKDERFRDGLSAGDRSAMPDHPAGFVALDDSALESVVGGFAALVDQTGTGSPDCSCVKTQTAISGGGSCNCTCPDQLVAEGAKNLVK
jgi:mersacidin/lichenicidin family type 2 lantibiotic